MSKNGERRRFTDSLMGRQVLSTIVPAVLVMAAIVTVNGMRRYHLALRTAREGLALRATEFANLIDGINQSAVAATRSLAAAETATFGRREQSLRITRDLLERNPEYTGITVGYEPNADGQDASRVPTGGIDAGGRFIPYWFRDWKRADAVTLKPLSGMDTDEWYVAPREAWNKRRSAEVIVTEPYDYEGRLMVTYTAGLEHEGKFVGVVGVDRALEELHKEVTRRAEEDGIDIYVVSPKGKIVIASDGSRRPFPSDPDTWQTKSMDSVPIGPVLKQLGAATKTQTTDEMPDPAAGGSSFFAAAPIETGGWTLVMAVPSSTVTMPIVADISVTVAIALAGVLVMSVVIYVPTRRLVRRVDQAASAAQQVAAGDLTRASSGSTCPDETGDLLRALDSMTADLNALVGQVRGASADLATTTVELAATSQRQEEVAASFGASSAEIAAAVRQINATGQELSREMEHVNDVAVATSKLAQDGRGQLETMEGAMQSLDQATVGVADRLAAINEKAVNIGGVVTTITKVAEQTNLLSVNAAIEAEKAGEYGRGFLVVAREIRRLADQTGQATLDIERMVKEMQGAVSSGVMEMDRFSEQVRRNVSDVRTIGRSMTQIIGSVDEAGRSFGTVREGMRSQSAGAGQISEAMAALSMNAKATSEAVREFGAAAEVLQRSIGTLKTAIAAFQLRT